MTESKKTLTKNSDSNPYETALQEEKKDQAIKAQMIQRPSFKAADTITSFGGAVKDTGFAPLVHELTNQACEVKNGDLTRIESILVIQAHTLDTIFNKLAQHSALNIGTSMNAAETYLRLALKAQTQCRSTLETLSKIKNPPIVFAKQANLTTGPQQVNNCITTEKTTEAVNDIDSEVSDTRKKK